MDSLKVEVAGVIAPLLPISLVWDHFNTKNDAPDKIGIK